MKLLEHEAKSLLGQAGVPVPRASIVHGDDLDSLKLPVVLKSQVPVGGRGKAGGISIVNDPAMLAATAREIFGKPISGYLPKTLLAEEKIAIKRELYLSLLVDRSSMSIQMMAHRNGGIEVEDNDNFMQRELNDPNFDALGQELANYFDLPGQSSPLQDLLEKLYDCLIRNDALLLEINPLILTNDGELVAGDCKMLIDDAASFRHNWDFEWQPAEANFVTINTDGNVATIANGAGLAMATVDAAYDAGLSPANFLDIGGGATTETLLKAFHRIVEYPALKAIVINIFAGITQADEVARAIVAAREQITTLPPLFIRLAGTNYEAAAAILTENSINILPDLSECLAAAKEAIDE